MQENYVIENKVKLARVEKELTQAQLAKKVGVARQTIIAIEANQYYPKIPLAYLLANCLDKEITELFIFHGPFEKGED
ncbi:helix-turn-helix transcriptional regulator [candidate division KSB1 bacterium]